MESHRCDLCHSQTGDEVEERELGLPEWWRLPAGCVCPGSGRQACFEAFEQIPAGPYWPRASQEYTWVLTDLCIDEFINEMFLQRAMKIHSSLLCWWWSYFYCLLVALICWKSGPNRKNLTQGRSNMSRTHHNIPSRAAPGPPGTAFTSYPHLAVVFFPPKPFNTQHSHVFLCRCSPEWWPVKRQPCSQSEKLTASQTEAFLIQQRYTPLPAQQHQPCEGARWQSAAARLGLSESPWSRSCRVRNLHTLPTGK